MELLDFEIFLSCAAIHGPPYWSEIFRNVLSQPLFWFSKYSGPGPTGVSSGIPEPVNSFDVEMDRIKNINMK